MSPQIWPVKEISIPSLVDLRFGGIEGRDVKVMFFPSTHKEYHYTCTMFTGPKSLAAMTVPLDIHKTWDGPPPKHHLSLARGMFDMQPLVRRVIRAGMPRAEPVDLSSSVWLGRQAVSLNPLVSILGSKKLTITPEWVNQMEYRSLSSFDEDMFLAAVSSKGGRAGGIVMRADNRAYFIQIPVLELIDEFEDEMESSLHMTKLADLEQEFDDVLGNKVLDEVP